MVITNFSYKGYYQPSFSRVILIFFTLFIVEAVFSIVPSSFDARPYFQIETPSIIAFFWDESKTITKLSELKLVLKVRQ